MRYLGLALYGEGPGEYQFLPSLLLRLTEHLCVRESHDRVDVGEVVALNHPADMQARPREERIAAAAALHAGAWDIVFIHVDGAGNPEKAREDVCAPALRMLRQRFPAAAPGVAVVPVRETEAWVLADGDALRNVFGVRMSDTELGLPQPTHLVETCLDPKATLRAAFMATRPTGLRQRRGVAPMLNALGEQVALDRLAQLPSFERLTNDLRHSLRTLGILRA